MARIVSLILGLSVVSSPTWAADLFMSCSFGFLRGLAPAPSIYKYSNTWIGQPDIYVQSSGKWARWCSMSNQTRTIKDAAGICNTSVRERRIIVSKIDFNEVTYAIIEPRVSQFKCEQASNMR